jgi:hypothetical protein
MADHTFQLEGNSVGDGLRAKLNIPESGKNVHRARNQKVSRFFADLSCDRLISESVKDDSGIRRIMNEAGGRLNPGDDALRVILDATPALIHTGRPDEISIGRMRPFGFLSMSELSSRRWSCSSNVFIRKMLPRCKKQLNAQ